MFSRMGTTTFASSPNVDMFITTAIQKASGRPLNTILSRQAF